MKRTQNWRLCSQDQNYILYLHSTQQVKASVTEVTTHCMSISHQMNYTTSFRETRLQACVHSSESQQLADKPTSDTFLAQRPNYTDSMQLNRLILVWIQGIQVPSQCTFTRKHTSQQTSKQVFSLRPKDQIAQIHVTEMVATHPCQRQSQSHGVII